MIASLVVSFTIGWSRLGFLFSLGLLFFGFHFTVSSLYFWPMAACGSVLAVNCLLSRMAFAHLSTMRARALLQGNTDSSTSDDFAVKREVTKADQKNNETDTNGR